MGKKRIFILGFILVLLAAIPTTVWFVHLQTQTQQRAAPSTTLSFNPAQKSVQPGQAFSADIVMDPGQNQVSFVKLDISYDATKFATASPGIVNNSQAFPQILEGPFFGPCNGNFCSISYTVGIGADPTKAVTAKTTVATLSFTTLTPADNSPSQITLGNNTKVLSIASSDQASENVLSTTNSLTVTFSGVVNGTPSPFITPSITPSTTPTNTPTVLPTNTPLPLLTGVTTLTPSPSASVSAAPICSSLSVDQAVAVPPATIMFTANGNSPGGTVSKVTFNFGDGSVQDVTSGGGIGTNQISAQLAHTFNTNGTYTATATLTDNAGQTSTGGCSQTITIASQSALPSGGTTVQPTTVVKTLPKTGPGDTFLLIGGAGVILTVIGGILFFIL